MTTLSRAPLTPEDELAGQIEWYESLRGAILADEKDSALAAVEAAIKLAENKLSRGDDLA